MLIRALPLIAGFLPLVGIHAALWLSMDAGTIPSCNPYFDGCTSISATGRYMPGAMPFRAGLMPQAAFLIVLWWFVGAWLRNTTGSDRYSHFIWGSGLIGAVALVVYVTFLGTTLPFYEFMRYVGIYFYFLGIGLAQLLTSLAMKPSRMRNIMLAIVLAPWLFGIANLVQKALITTPNNIENRVEWVASLMMQLWFIALYRAWRDSFSLRSC